MTSVEKLKDAISKLDNAMTQNGIYDFATPSRSEKTIEIYSRIYKRIGALPNPFVDSSHASFKVHRSALMFFGAELAYRNMKYLIELYKSGEYSGDKVMKAYTAIITNIKLYSQASKAQRPPAPEKIKKITSKHKVPRESDWQADVLKVVAPAARLAVALLWSVGLRPAEIAKGVQISRLKNRNLVVRVTGAKQSTLTNAGQSWRVVEVDVKTKAGEALFKLFKEHEAEMVDGVLTYARNTRLLEDNLELAGWKAGFDKRLSAYVFRHAFASDLKTAGDPNVTAKAMGHKSIRSQSPYGNSKSGKSGRSPVVSVEAAREITGLASFTRGPKVELQTSNAQSPTPSL